MVEDFDNSEIKKGVESMKNNKKIKELERIIKNKNTWERLKDCILSDEEIEKLMNNKNIWEKLKDCILSDEEMEKLMNDKNIWEKLKNFN